VTTLAGTSNTTGTADGTGSAARFNEPFGITLSGSDFYVADTFNHAIRKLTSAGLVTTLAGTAGPSGSTDGTGSAARFYTPKSLVSDSTNLYVTDTSNHTIRKIILSTGAVTTLAGYAGTSGTTDGTGSVARFNAPFGIAYDGTDLYVTDTVNQTIRKVSTSGVVTTLAGVAGTTGTTDATGTAAKFNNPTGVVILGGNLYVADSSNHTIRQVVIATGVVTTLAGGAGVSGSTDGTGTAARFNSPVGLTIDTSGNLYVTDQNYTKIRKVVVSSGVVTTLPATF
jgi:predicted nucleic acid-binding Zn ribbon protein